MDVEQLSQIIIDCTTNLSYENRFDHPCYIHHLASRSKSFGGIALALLEKPLRAALT